MELAILHAIDLDWAEIVSHPFSSVSITLLIGYQRAKQAANTPTDPALKNYFFQERRL